MQYVSGRDTTLHHDVRKSWRARIVLAIAESKKACRRHLIDPIPEVRHFFPNVAKYEEGPEERVTALLVTEKNNVYYRHAARAAREPGGRGALVFGLDCAELNEEEVQGHFKAAIGDYQLARVTKLHLPQTSTSISCTSQLDSKVEQIQ